MNVSGGECSKMKRVLLLITISLLFIITACSSEDMANPNERFQEFTNLWMEQDFQTTYHLFSTETKDSISQEESIERLENLYNDLGIENIEITFDELTDEQIDSLIDMDEEHPSTTIPFSVELESIAGPIAFDYEATLVLETINEEETDWFINWDVGFIHPELKDGGEVSIQTVHPERGEILDRNQMPLAMNDTVYQIGIVPDDLTDEEAAIEDVSRILNMDANQIDEALQASWVEGHLFVPLATILPSNEEVYEQLMAIPGVQRMEVSGRIYPGGEAVGHLIGYIGDITADFLEEADSDEYGPNDQVGRRGLEGLYETELKGKRGVTILIEKEDEEEIVIAESPVENGENIQLTIDINIQEKIYESYDGDAGTTTAIDPITGETLALVSAPSFDPNDIVYSTSDSIWDRLEEDEKQPLINRFAATFAPGSVIKPVTAAAGINAGTLDPNEGFEIEGKHWSNGEGWGDYEVTRVSLSDGPVDLEDAMLRSDNIYFAMQAVAMGSDAFVDEFERFGFGEEIPYKYPISSSSLSNSGELDDEVLLANSSYGQGELEMSALHLAATYTTFLNEGNMIKPTLLLEEDIEQVWQEGLMSKEEAERMDEILRGVVTDGTAQRAEDDANVPIAGKTGTVELKLGRDSDGSINSWFIGYPYESKDILLAMLVEETEDKESGHAIGMFAEIINELHSEDE